MSAVSFSGLATGLNTGSIVAQLVELRRAPVYRLQKRKAGFEAQQKALDVFKTKLLALQTAAQKVDTAGEFSSVKSSVANEDMFSVTTGSTATAGTYEIKVNQLAQAQKDVSQGFDSKLDTVGTGTLSFTVGGETTELTLVGFNSLESLANKINNDVAGVSASIVFDGSATGGYHLVLGSTEAGSAGAYTVDTSGLSGGTAPVFTSTRPALDALLTIDDIEVVATSNNPADVISGLTLNLKSISTETTTLKVETDLDSIAANIKGLVDAYNSVFSYITEQSAVGGTLRDNPALRSAASQVEGLFTSALTGGLGDKTLLSQVGILRGDGRQIKFDEDKFKTALAADFGGVRDLFIKREGNIGKSSLIDAAIDNMTDSIDGLFKHSGEALVNKIKYADQSIERYERSIESYQLTMTRRFTAMEAMVSQLQAQGNYLSSAMQRY